MKKLIVRIKGGLGNQLFSYATARRLAFKNNAELVIDDVTGFKRDTLYNRRYCLDTFSIPCRKATPSERMEIFERYRRFIIRKYQKLFPFEKRNYIEQEGINFDPRVLTLTWKKSAYIEGLWQSENYFKDIESIIREDLIIQAPKDDLNLKVADEIQKCNSISLHVRWFTNSHTDENYNLSSDYYSKAITKMEESIEKPFYFVFSDNPEGTINKINLPINRFKIIKHNLGDENAYKDMYLMGLCKNFIIANSTFSWWGAWLSGNSKKIIISPNFNTEGITAWGFPGLIPDSWIQL